MRVATLLVAVVAILTLLPTGCRGALTRKDIDEANRKCHTQCGIRGTRACMAKCWKTAFSGPHKAAHHAPARHAPVHRAPARRAAHHGRAAPKQHVVHNAGRTYQGAPHKRAAPTHKGSSFRSLDHSLVRGRGVRTEDGAQAVVASLALAFAVVFGSVILM